MPVNRANLLRCEKCGVLMVGTKGSSVCALALIQTLINEVIIMKSPYEHMDNEPKSKCKHTLKATYKKMAFAVLAILSVCVLANGYILYNEIIQINVIAPAYDYRIAVFGNDGNYPEEAVAFASSLNDKLSNVVIEQIGVNFNSQGYNVFCVALDRDTFVNWYTAPIDTQKPYAVLSSLYSIGLGETENISVYVKDTALNVIGVSPDEIPCGAMSNVPLPSSMGPTLLLVTTQEVANELYELSPSTRQRQISIYYQTDDGKALTKQMETYSPKQISGTQIWDNQDYTKNSSWAISTLLKKVIRDICVIVFTILLESVILFSAYSLKKNY